MPMLDTAYLLQLAEYCATSQQASKDASKALRKEFKHAVPMAQERALRVLVSPSETWFFFREVADHGV